MHGHVKIIDYAWPLSHCDLIMGGAMSPLLTWCYTMILLTLEHWYFISYVIPPWTLDLTLNPGTLSLALELWHSISYPWTMALYLSSLNAHTYPWIMVLPLDPGTFFLTIESQWYFLSYPCTTSLTIRHCILSLTSNQRIYIGGLLLLVLEK